MRALDFIFEDNKTPPKLSGLKDKVIQQVKRTDDETLLDRIYTVLNQTNLSDKISGVLDNETDTKGYVDAITKIIIDTPGTYEEKDAFITGFPDGYVNISKMLSGERVKFDDLLTGGENKKAPMRFIKEVFNALKQVTFGTAKGPGEFALAVLSPHIKITGKGDLNIGDMVIEVKASAGKEISSGGGRLGTPGLLDHRGIQDAIQKALDGYRLSSIAPKGLTLGGFVKLLTTAIKPEKRRPLATKVFNIIFGGKSNTSGIVSAALSGDENATSREYVKANYQAYKTQSGFKGLMIMNFALGELKYFTDPEQMASEIYSINVYIVSSKESDASRQILSQVTLAAAKEPPLILPSTTDEKGRKIKEKEFKANVMNFTVRLAQSYNITDTVTVNQMYEFVLEQIIGGASKESIIRKLKTRYPQMVKKKAKPEAEPQTQTKTAVRKPAVKPKTPLPNQNKMIGKNPPGSAPTRKVPGQAV